MIFPCLPELFPKEKPTLTARAGDAIIIRGARAHNLRNITVEIPLNSLTVVTGVSGSGKSSLAFDTLYAEGQRRYIASLSAYARQFLDRIDRPDVDDIEGICPALAIRQKNHSRNPRSTVGTVTEINDYLRLLFARIGVTTCHGCGRAVKRDTPGTIADFILALEEGQKFYLCTRLDLSPPPAEAGRRGKKGTAAAGPAERLQLMLPGLERQGFVRLLVGGELTDPAGAVEALARSGSDEVRVIVDRLTVRADLRPRLVDSLEVCSRESGGRLEVLLLTDEPGELMRRIGRTHPDIRTTRHPAGVLVPFSEAFECQLCGISYREPEPRLFSFNNPFGACPACQGFGNTQALDLDRVIPDQSLSLAAGAIHPWARPRFRRLQARMLQFAASEGIDAHIPWRDLPEPAREKVLQGGGRFPGVLGFFEYLERKKYKVQVRVLLSRYRGYAPCLECGGSRLAREARNVLIAGRSITDIAAMTTAEALAFFSGLELDPERAAVAERLLAEIGRRLDLLVRVGLDYVTLDRLSSTLSGGEAQRIQLAASLGSSLVGALYVLDEPSIGLHPKDSRRLVEILRGLKELGNTVVVVEHDPEIMKSADHVIDLGPRAGEHGGQVVFEGSYDRLLQESGSLTGRYLRGELAIPLPRARRARTDRALTVRNARLHNLRHLDVSIPLDMLVCVTGVSGSGKSTLVHDLLYPAVRKVRGESGEFPAGVDSVDGAGLIADIVMVDQSPIGRTPRSNPATYTGAYDDIRRAFAATTDARSRGFGPGHFSFNLETGRCPACQGNGTVTVEMQFLADVELVCEDCGGKRFNPRVLEVRYRSKNIAEVLELTIGEALEFFAGRGPLLRKLRILDEIGLGYLRLGQSATTLSGGEAQRIKLAAFLARADTRNTLFIFDEPTTGLHFDDIRVLLAAFDRLLATGNSLLVIEHNLEVIKAADWVIDLGPEGGEGGGRLVFEGTPENLGRCPESHTGRTLRDYLSHGAGVPAPRGGEPRDAA